MEMGYPEKLEAIRRNIRQVIVGKDEVVNKLLIALICSGHVLIEDMPGLGKSSLHPTCCRRTSPALRCSI